MVATATSRFADVAPVYGSAALRRYRRLAGACQLAAAATVAVIVAGWLADGGVQTVTTPGGPALSLGRLTGLVGSDLLLLQVLAMARIPVVERAWGQQRLTRWHRRLGESSFFLIVAHIVLITIGYTQSGTMTLWPQAWNLLTTYPGMLLAAAGTIALFAVVGTSIRAARRRLRYESWHLLHLYAYLGVGLVLPHQLWTGADFLASTAMTVFWWSLWALAGASIVIFRLIIPVVRSLVHRLVVESIRPEGPNVQSVVIRGRNLDALRPAAGHYFQWRFLAGPGWTRAHPYSVSALPTADRLRITMRLSGDEAGRLARLSAGTRVLVEGPFGSLTADRRRHRDVLLLAAGVGMTPLRGLAECIAAEGPSPGPGGLRRPSVLVMHRISDIDGSLFATEWRQLAERTGIRVAHLVGPRGAAATWLPVGQAAEPARLLAAAVPDLATRDVYLCGPRPWMDAVRSTLDELGVAPGTIHAEGFER